MLGLGRCGAYAVTPRVCGQRIGPCRPAAWTCSGPAPSATDIAGCHSLAAATASGRPEREAAGGGLPTRALPLACMVQSLFRVVSGG